METPTRKSRRVLVVVALATALIFGGLVAFLTLRLRGALREEVLRREAEAIHAVALMQLRLADERAGAPGGARTLEEAFTAVLESSKLRGVFGVHVFDPAGKLYDALPVFPRDDATPPWWQGKIARPEARFAPAASLEAALGIGFDEGDTTRAPLVDVAVPLVAADGAFLGVARYWMEGGAMEEEFRRMDQRLLGQSGVAFAGGLLLIAAVLAWASARLAAANRRLLEQSADLARANAELDFAAKTNALGAISAHLIHGLKNPLAGLEGFVAETVMAPDALSGEACRAAVDTTRRLRALVSEVSEVLRDEAAEAAEHAVPAAEIVAAARIRAIAAAEQAGVTLEMRTRGDAAVDARSARLAGLVLANLLQNAIEASPRGGAVAIEAGEYDERVDFIVRDTGPGLPAAVQRALFRPVRSGKRGGGGVGLAISHRLARHAGGELTLVRSDGHGAEFRLTVPVYRKAVNESSTSRA